MADPGAVVVAAIRARWSTEERHHPNYWADHAGRDIPALLFEVDRLQSEVSTYKTALGGIETRAASALNAGVQIREARPA